MNTIAIVDDRELDRKTAQRRIKRGLSDLGVEGEWRVIGVEPLTHLEDYPAWLTGQDVKVLILDQRLNEMGEDRVEYTGHDVVNRIMPRMFDLPVYYLTSVKDVSDIEGDLPRVQAILQRDEFVKSDPGPWAKEFIREGLRYEEKVAQKLARLSELAERAVAGELEPDERIEAQALRQELQLVFEGGSPLAETENATRAELLNEFEREIGLFDEALVEFRQLLEAAVDDQNREQRDNG